MVVELRVGRPEVAVACLDQLAAQVDVIERDWQVLLVEPAHLEEAVLPDDEAGRGHGAVVLHEAKAVLLPLVAPREFLERVAGHAAQAEDDPCVLHRVQGIVEHRAHRADPRADRVAHHLREPVAVDRLDVIVEQADHVAVGLSHRKVVDRRIVERRVERKDPRARVAATPDLRQIFDRLRVVRLVVDYDDLVVRIVGGGQYAVDRLPHELGRVAGGYDERHERGGGGHRVLDPPVVAWDRVHLDRLPAPPEVILKRHAGRLDGIALLGELERGRAGDRPPVVQELRYVPYRGGRDAVDRP